MLKINKKTTTTIYDINLTSKITKEINNFFSDEIKCSNKYININDQNTQLAEDYIEVNNLYTMIEWLKDDEWTPAYFTSKQYLIKRLNQIIEFCESRGIKYVWSVSY
jgi:hypothetical protein